MWRRPPDPRHRAEIVPPRMLEESASAARGMLGALVSESFTLDVAIRPSGPRYFVRAANTATLERVVAQLRAAYPQAEVEADQAPAAPDPTAHTSTLELRPTDDSALPLRLAARGERDPLSAAAAAVQPGSGECVVLSLALAPAHRREADRIRRRQEPSSYERRADDRGASTSIMPVLALLLLGAGGLQGWRWYQAGEWAFIAGAAVAIFVGLPLAAAVALRVLRGRGPLPRLAVTAKLSGPLMAARLTVIATAPDRNRARMLSAQASAAYAAYDEPQGGGLRPGPPGRRRFPLVLNAGECAALWHLPETQDAPPRVRRTTASHLALPPGHAAQGVRVGQAAVAGRSEPVHFSDRLLHRNHLLVAKTRRGKSTLLRHLAAGLMERVAAGEDHSAVVVVDPHQDLAEAVLASVPEPLVDRTVYLDFAHLEQPIGLNLLDVELFPDRDRTVEGVVTMMRRLWPDNWGPRMEGALRASLASLHELNTRRSRVEQFTLLDVAPFLTSERMRRELLPDVTDLAVLAWWRDNYDRAGQVLRQQTANPVTSKVGRFTVTEASRLVFGQPRSTFNPRDTLREGGVLVINTAVGTLGEGAASLVGATVLNLLGLLVEEQVSLAPDQRRNVVQFVDESSTLGAVDYGRMLSELGKYGANYALVTQALSKLDAVDRELLPTILSNSDALTVFQCSAEDARRLLPELGGDLTVEDLVSLNDYSAYARWWDGFARPAAFTFAVDPPPPLDERRVSAIAARSAHRYGRPRDQVMAEVQEVLAARFAERPEDTGQLFSEEELRGTITDPSQATLPTGRAEHRAGAPIPSRTARSRNQPTEREVGT